MSKKEILPLLASWQNSMLSIEGRRLLILAEGFEARSLHWVSSLPCDVMFDHAIVCKYAPERKSRLGDLLGAVSGHVTQEPTILEYNRFSPTEFEQSLSAFLGANSDYDEIVIDISVMSKLLIMIILCALKTRPNSTLIVYSEPESWGPSEDLFKDVLRERTDGTCIALSSIGVREVVTTPGLASVVMQDCPQALVAFLSFNEQLVNALVSEINPTKLYLFGHTSERVPWRNCAIKKIHEGFVEEYSEGSFCAADFDLLDYGGVFLKLAEIYKNNCYDYRIILSPTGPKIHTVACSLLKMCCEDVHVDYPSPEKYLFADYSSESVFDVHAVRFPPFKDFILELSNDCGLNG